MKTRIVRIGNSRGIRIPKALFEQWQPGDSVELEAKTNSGSDWDKTEWSR